MPLYEYQCPKCGRFELIRKFSDEAVTTCPTCGSKVQKLASAPAFHLKGTGWYATDYAKKSPGDSKSGQGKSDEGKPGEGKPGQRKSGDSKAGDSKSGDSKSSESKSGDSGKTAGSNSARSSKDSSSTTTATSKKTD